MSTSSRASLIKVASLNEVDTVLNHTCRLIWFVVVCTCSGVCVFLISEIWIRWLTQPTITTVERTDYEVWNIFYPGVSFCSNNKMDTNAWEIFERKRRADWDSGKVGFNYIYLHTTCSIIYLLDYTFFVKSQHS